MMDANAMVNLQARFRVGMELVQSSYDRLQAMIEKQVGDGPPQSAPAPEPLKEPPPGFGEMRFKRPASPVPARRNGKPSSTMTRRGEVYLPLVEFLSTGNKTTEEVAEKFGKIVKHAFQLCDRAARKGLIRKVERGVWGPLDGNGHGARGATRPTIPTGARKMTYEETRERLLGKIEVPRDEVLDQA